MLTSLGFTGTQVGMTELQKKTFIKFLDSISFNEFHHGDCLGADKQAHDMVNEHAPWAFIVIHPPLNTSKRAFCAGQELRAPKEYLIRNRDIVKECDILVATPQGPEKMRSGTWATVREARRTGKRHLIIFPDGKMENKP